MNGTKRVNRPAWPNVMERVMDASRRVVQCLWVRLLFLSGALWWAKRELKARGAVVVLTFHRVLDDSCFAQTDSLANIIVRSSTFTRLARYVSHQYEAVDVRRAVPGVKSDRLRVAFTFDDGWRDNLTNALATLGKYSIPATIFLCTGLTDQKSPFWPEKVRGTLHESLHRSYGSSADRLIEALIEAFKYCPAEARQNHLDLLLQQTNGAPAKLYDGDATLSWDQILHMQRQGVAFGSHTHTHQILTTVSPDRAKAELSDSKAAIEECLKDTCETFAYPNGNWSPDIRELVAESGYRLAFTTSRRAWLSSTDPLAIPRSNVQQEDLVGLTGRFSAAMFDYATFWKVWQYMRRVEKHAAVAIKTPAMQEAR